MAQRRFCDFSEEVRPLDGEKITINLILNKEVEITGHKIRASKYEKNKTGQCLMLQMMVDNEKRVLFTGSDVLIDQLKKYGDNVPFFATIIKIDRYYTLS